MKNLRGLVFILTLSLLLVGCSTNPISTSKDAIEALMGLADTNDELDAGIQLKAVQVIKATWPTQTQTQLFEIQGTYQGKAFRGLALGSAPLGLDVWEHAYLKVKKHLVDGVPTLVGQATPQPENASAQGLLSSPIGVILVAQNKTLPGPSVGTPLSLEPEDHVFYAVNQRQDPEIVLYLNGSKSTPAFAAGMAAVHLDQALPTSPSSWKGSGEFAAKGQVIQTPIGPVGLVSGEHRWKSGAEAHSIIAILIGL